MPKISKFTSQNWWIIKSAKITSQFAIQDTRGLLYNFYSLIANKQKNE
jgi:hypothetical protein